MLLHSPQTAPLPQLPAPYTHTAQQNKTIPAVLCGCCSGQLSAGTGSSRRGWSRGDRPLPSPAACQPPAPAGEGTLEDGQGGRTEKSPSGPAAPAAEGGCQPPRGAWRLAIPGCNARLAAGRGEEQRALHAGTRSPRGRSPAARRHLAPCCAPAAARGRGRGRTAQGHRLQRDTRPEQGRRKHRHEERGGSLPASGLFAKYHLPELSVSPGLNPAEAARARSQSKRFRLLDLRGAASPAARAEAGVRAFGSSLTPGCLLSSPPSYGAVSQPRA